MAVAASDVPRCALPPALVRERQAGVDASSTTVASERLFGKASYPQSVDSGRGLERETGFEPATLCLGSILARALCFRFAVGSKSCPVIRCSEAHSGISD